MAIIRNYSYFFPGVRFCVKASEMACDAVRYEIPKFLTFLNNFQYLQRIVINPISVGNPIKKPAPIYRGALIRFAKRGRKARRRK